MSKPEGQSDSGVQKIIEVVARLRSETGCPWDREQTLDSLKQYLIEESYELVEAIESGSPDKHREELGDVLLQVLLQAKIREEEGKFDFDDVAKTLAEKLIRRHPHVFGDVSAEDSDAVLRNWEIIKAEEKGAERESILQGVPRRMPALQRAQRVQSRVARVGFDWENMGQVFDKVDEEYGELKKAMHDNDADGIREEVGDLLFALVNLSRRLGVEAEESLRKATDKFINRFKYVEKRISETGRKLQDSTLCEMDAFWNDAKKEENG